MGWISDRQKTIAAAFGPFWPRVITIPTLLAATVFAIARKWLESKGMTIVPVPTWIIWALVALLLASFWLMEYANKLRLDRIPKIELRAVAPQTEILKVQPASLDDSNEIGKIAIRGEVTGLSQSEVQCRAFVTAIRQQQSDGQFIAKESIASIPLHWFETGDKSESVWNGVTKRFDILQADPRVDKPYIPGDRSIALFRKLFDRPAKYEVDILVTADDVSSKMTIEVNWTGQWNELHAKERT